MGIARNIEELKARVREIAPGAQLLAVSKTFGTDAVREAYRVGQRAFGENYLQEALGKIEELRDELPGLSWHFIGALQSNKTRAVAERFDWVQSVTSLRLARRLSEQRPGNLPKLNVLVEVNVDASPTKSGVAPESLMALLEGACGLPGIALRGLMAIPDPAPEEELRRKFLRMKALFDEANAAGFALDTLSMGMSADFELALACGSTMVRIGTAVFGARSYPSKA